VAGLTAAGSPSRRRLGASIQEADRLEPLRGSTSGSTPRSNAWVNKSGGHARVNTASPVGRARRRRSHGRAPARCRSITRRCDGAPSKFPRPGPPDLAQAADEISRSMGGSMLFQDNRRRGTSTSVCFLIIVTMGRTRAPAPRTMLVRSRSVEQPEGLELLDGLSRSS